jgi:hypothetical protein
MRTALVVACGLAAAGCRFPDTMTAVDHERAAEARRAEVEKAEATVRTLETTRPLPSGSEAVGDPGAPLAGYAQGRVGYDSADAAKHEEAALRIRRDAELACVRVPAAERSSCPIDEVARVEPLAGGARLFFKQAPVAESLQARIGCAVAEAHVDRPLGAERCPLLVPGSAAHVVDRPGEAGGAFVEITARDGAASAEVRRRAEALLRR